MEHDLKKKKDITRQRGSVGSQKTGSRKPSTGSRSEWRSSQGMNHRFGEEDMGVRSSVKGLHEPEKETDDRSRMHESYRMENSFGTISMGFNKDKKSTLVLSSKRGSEGSARETEKNLHMESSRKDYNRTGEFFTNQSENMGGAWAFMGETSMPDLKILNRVVDFQRRYDSDLIKEKMPFLQLREKREELASLSEQAKEYGLMGDRISQKEAQRAGESLKAEIEELEQERRRVRKNLQFGWQKSKLAAESQADIREEHETEDLTKDPDKKSVTTATPQGSSDTPAQRNRRRKPKPEEKEGGEEENDPQEK